MPSIDQIAQALDSLGLEYREFEDYIKTSCPFAKQSHEGQEDVNPSFDISTEGAHCWSCKYRASLEEFFDHYADYTGSDKTFDFDFEQYFKPKKAKVDEPNVILSESILEVFDKDDIRIRDYLDSRGIFMEHLGFPLYLDASKGRVVMAVRDAQGNLIGAASRQICEGYGGKNYNYFGYSTAKALLNIDQCQGVAKCIVCEGLTDVWSAQSFLNELGIADTGVVALQGSKISEYQANLLDELGATVLLATDLDEAGLKARKAVKEALTECYILERFWPGGDRIDIGNMTKETFIKTFIDISC